MADKKITALSERAQAIVGTDLLMIVTDVATTPTNYKVPVKNFLAQLQIDLPQTSNSAFKVTAAVAAAGATAALAAGEFRLLANSSVGVASASRCGLSVHNEILNSSTTVANGMFGALVRVDPGTSAGVAAANTYGLVVEHTIANTAQARAIAPRAFVAFRDAPGTGGQATTYLLDLGATGNAVSANLSTGNASVLFTKAANTTITHKIKVNVNGTDYWLCATSAF
jgi:hypothetical protein